MSLSAKFSKKHGVKPMWHQRHNVQSCRWPDLTSNYHKHDDSETFSVLELLGHTKRLDVFFIIQITQPAFTCSKLKIGTLEQGVKICSSKFSMKTPVLLLTFNM